MSPDTLRAEAILVADAHCAPWRTPFVEFLRALESGEIQTPQLILMGDIFDLLFGPIESTHLLNAEPIALLNRLADRMEIVYLEGNHDFLLSDLFPRIRIFSRDQQPWRALCGERQIALSHGDLAMGTGYGLYTALIRNRLVLRLLRLADRLGGGWIIRYLEGMMRRKDHCKTIAGFDALSAERIKGQKLTGIDTLIEGHFHQNRRADLSGLHYINLAAFACGERYFRLHPSERGVVLEERVFRKEFR